MMASNDASEERGDKPAQEKCEGRMVCHMNIAAHQHLSKLLRPYCPGRDWRNLAGLMGFTYEDILKFECDFDPVESIIRLWEREPDATVDKLLLLLKKLERLDAIEDLQPFIAETPTPSEYEAKRKKVLDECQQSPANGKLPIELERLTVSDEIFDGFICYAKEDRSFANEILTKLEAKPYCRKICIDYRDYVPGNCKLDQTAKIIEHRCKHLVAIMSPNFRNSPDAGFQVRIALNLSPDFDKRRVIPILYENCEVPEILRPIYHLNYQDPIESDHFWRRLASALGYTEPTKPRGSPIVDKKSKGSPVMDTKLKQSPLFDKKVKQSPLLEKKVSPLIEKRSKGGLFNKKKSKK